MGLRKITAVPIGTTTNSPAIGAVPEIVWVAPTDLLVDDTYQRKMSEATVRLLRKTIEGFSWSRLKVPVGVRAEGGIHLIDGQHTAIAAATRKIEKVPVLVVQADSLAERARAFVGHNTDHAKVSPIDIYKALLAAGDEDAADVAAVCKRANVRIRVISPSVRLVEGDTNAVARIRRLVKNRGVIFSRQLLEVLVKARCVPITSRQIDVVERLMTGPRAITDLQRIVRVIRADGDGLMAATNDAKKRKVSITAALYDRWSSYLKGEAA